MEIFYNKFEDIVIPEVERSLDKYYEQALHEGADK